MDEAPSDNGMTVVRVQTEDDKRILAYQMFVDCSGQRPLEIEDYPFRSLVENGRVTRARARFADATSAKEWVGSERQKHLFTEDGQPLYHISGVEIDGSYRVVGEDGQPNPRIYDIAFPHTAGVRPYSYGLQACNTTCAVLVQTWVDAIKSGTKVESEIEEVSKVYAAV